jgi:hypothetical protein
MDGKMTPGAVLNGDVRTIPLIDKTLENEGQAADAKATGERFRHQAAVSEMHGIQIADNAAAIQTLLAENGAQDVALGEHDTLIAGHTKKIGELEAKVNTINVDALKEQANTNEDHLREVMQSLVAYDLGAVPEHVVTDDATKCTVYGNVCTVFFNFSSPVDNENELVYSGLPKPANAMVFLLYNTVMDNMQMFSLYESGEGFGVVRPSNGASHGRYIGNITYIVG